jgi:hypothetical protein
LAHRLTAQLDVFAKLIDAARKPALERAAAIVAVGAWPFLFDVSADRQREFLQAHVKLESAELERIRCARHLLADEHANCQP